MSFETRNVKLQKHTRIHMMKTHYNTPKGVSFEVQQSIKTSCEVVWLLIYTYFTFILVENQYKQQISLSSKTHRKKVPCAETSVRRTIIRCNFLRRNFITLKFPYGENSQRRNFLTAKFPTAKFSTAKFPTAKFSGTKNAYARWCFGKFFRGKWNIIWPKKILYFKYLFCIINILCIFFN